MPAGRLLLVLALALTRVRPAAPCTLRVLAVGDSLTEGAVPSEGRNHPYTGEMTRVLRQQCSACSVEATTAGKSAALHFACTFVCPRPPLRMAGCQQAPGNPAAGESRSRTCRPTADISPPRCHASCAAAGLGGGGIVAKGFNNPTTLVPFAKANINNGGSRYDVVCVMGGGLLPASRPDQHVACLVMTRAELPLLQASTTC
jgi:hypothetical protein